MSYSLMIHILSGISQLHLTTSLLDFSLFDYLNLVFQMNEIKKIEINDDRQSTSIPKRTSRSKPFLQKGRELFLTDSQTDQTKSSS